MLVAKNLSKTFRVGKQTLTAVSNLSLTIEKGETYGLVGESGCGKSTVGRTLLRLYEPTSGQIFFENSELLAPNPKKLQMVFQDPYSSLNPRMTIRETLLEPLQIHHVNSTPESLLAQVGLNTTHLNRFPHEFSGGQRQRIGIARALACQPKFLVLDEPISALDVSIQAQVLNLLKTLQKQMDLTYLFIGHDLSTVKYISDRIGVMYFGSLVEQGPTEKLFASPMHPYTQVLLSAIPIPDPRRERKRHRIIVPDLLPNPLDPPKGCPFAQRCPLATTRCHREKPQLQEIEPGHSVACFALLPQLESTMETKHDSAHPNRPRCLLPPPGKLQTWS